MPYIVLASRCLISAEKPATAAGSERRLWGLRMLRQQYNAVHIVKPGKKRQPLPGAMPGAVIYTDFATVLAEADEGLTEKLKQ